MLPVAELSRKRMPFPFVRSRTAAAKTDVKVALRLAEFKSTKSGDSSELGDIGYKPCYSGTGSLLDLLGCQRAGSQPRFMGGDNYSGGYFLSGAFGSPGNGLCVTGLRPDAAQGSNASLPPLPKEGIVMACFLPAL